VIVDSGNFDWPAHAERFPGLTQPDPSYHGVVWADALGPAAYIGRARTVLLRNLGAALSPFNAFLILQGVETLPLRMERHNANALAVARHLEGHPDVAWVYYPGLESSPYHAVADNVLQGGYGALVTFGVRGGAQAGKTFIESLELFSHLANIGDAKSLAIHNASTTHSQLNEDELEAAGVTQETVRLSIGIEHIDDIIGDLDQALAATRTVAQV
jgi:O-acetylhomoserine (thiol)-lyase